MGGTWFADDDGEFHLTVTTRDGVVLGDIHAEGLDSGAELYSELRAGRDR